MNKTVTVVALAVFLSLSSWGCSSTEEAPPATVKKTKRKKKKRVVAKLPVGAKEGMVMFSFKDALLRRDVPPLFEKQAGVRIKWHGGERKVSLRLTQPVHWEIALDLVCRFTKTHPTKDYRGQTILKHGYGGSLGTSQDADEALDDAGVEKAPASGGKAGPASRSSRSSRRRPSSPSKGYRETVTNTRGGGPDRSSGYNSGNQPNDLFNKIR